MVNKRLSDRLWDRTGLTLIGWVCIVVAVICFSSSAIIAWNNQALHQREQQEIRDTLRQIRDGLEADRRPSNPPK